MTYKILFVDDETHIFEIIKRKVERKEFKLYFAESAELALDIMAQEDIAILVTDLRMPGINGITLLENTKEKFPSTIRIVMSSMKDLNTIFVSIGKGQIFKYIRKPIMYEEELIPTLYSAIEKYLLQIEQAKDLADLKKMNEELEKEKHHYTENSVKNREYMDSILQLLLRYGKEVSKFSEDTSKYLNNPTSNQYEKNNLIEEAKQISDFSDSIRRHLKFGESYD